MHTVNLSHAFCTHAVNLSHALHTHTVNLSDAFRTGTYFDKNDDFGVWCVFVVAAALKNADFELDLSLCALGVHVQLRAKAAGQRGDEQDNYDDNNGVCNNNNPLNTNNNNEKE